MSEPAAIVRREDRRPAIESVLGGGDLRLMIEQARENVAAAVEIARGRGFVTDYDVKDKAGNVIGKRAFFHLQTWQLLAHAWGLTVLTEGEPTEVKPGTWQATAIVQTIEAGTLQGRAVALCSKNEAGKKYKSDHDLSATAQSRAARNAIRYTLGDLLIAAGFDFADPDAPATKEQTKAIWTLAGKHGWDRDEAHERAGVDSMKDLTRETAAELIDEWSDLDSSGGSPPAPKEAGEEPLANVEPQIPAPRSSSAGRDESETVDPSPAVSDSDPATQEQWQRLMLITGGSKQKAVNRVNRANGTQYTQANVVYATVAEVARAITGEKK